jgi:hypothetical protein
MGNDSLRCFKFLQEDAEKVLTIIASQGKCYEYVKAFEN